VIPCALSPSLSLIVRKAVILMLVKTFCHTVRSHKTIDSFG